ncbi:adenylate/guanylate cyclase domain-containing protein [Desulfococcaceae bacterium HSG8]|nr:adenylate/guanylate cyclase domain-containing protein [Desulfococcaceae bacterium HSG8]
MEKESSIFSKEEEVLKSAETLLKQNEVDQENFLSEYKTLLKHYKKLLRQTKTVTRVSDNQQRKLNRILERLGRYVSFQLFKKITHEKGKLEIKTQRKKLTVFFSDLQDFTYTSAHMEGEALSEFLNSYLEIMTQIVIKWGGTLDKYMGDAIMVFIGDPEFTTDEDHALRCVSMAIEMRENMRDLQKKWYELGYQEPLHCRMGIATGYCTVGNFGSSERMDYTIIGTPVNLASRLETAAEKDEIYISHETWGYVKDKIICEPPKELHLKGFHQKILSHKVISLRKEGEDNIFAMNDEEKGVNVKIDFSKIPKEDIELIIERLGNELKSENPNPAETVSE